MGKPATGDTKASVAGVYQIGNPIVIMITKSKMHWYGFITCSCLACLCFLPARLFGFQAYTLWLSQDAGSGQQSRIAAQYNHLWAAAVVLFGLLAVFFLFASYRSRRKAADLATATD